MAGKEFGARAGADNFTQEEYIKALDIAHLKGKSIYLTLNTLIKEREWNKLESFLYPLYENGLDGIIIQDLGLISFLKHNFPKLKIHASTQMTATGVYSCKLLKSEGIVRVVPARELSLEEIKEIKDKVDIEIEAFIHGAMCYCYSGQCLFSSFLGGRSGNRGRCAQPCRLNYTISDSERYIKKEDIKYPLSLKDMCTITSIDNLIKAGIDSFKIEGRLKRPEYVAGVTAIYRKYIDSYFENGEINVSEKDLDILKGLYVRSELSNGYYFRHNGPEMITKLNPSYNETNENINSVIAKKYLKTVEKIKVMGVVTLVVDEKASLILKYKDTVIAVEGAVVDRAQNRPLTEEDVKKQLLKTGESLFEFDRIEVEMENDCFMPVKFLNELRREAFENLKEALIYGE